ncbi:hypothetical protein G5V59_02735 [Nocardioides sp. W3-2-3]|nr:hypothetical protein [Nocardioides convexus]
MARSPEKCPYGCSICGRACKAAQRQSHRFDCCGEIAAHVPTIRNAGTSKAERTWLNVSNPMHAGYLTGPSQTTRKAS